MLWSVNLKKKKKKKKKKKIEFEHIMNNYFHFHISTFTMVKHFMYSNLYILIFKMFEH